MRKRALAVAMSAAMVCSMAGCTKSSSEEATVPATTLEDTSADKSADKEESTVADEADDKETTLADDKETTTAEDETTKSDDVKEIEILPDAQKFADAMKELVTSEGREIKFSIDLDQKQTVDDETTNTKTALEVSCVSDGNGNAKLEAEIKLDTDDMTQSYAGVISNMKVGLLVVDNKLYLDASSIAQAFVDALDAQEKDGASQIAGVFGTSVDEFLKNVQISIPLGDIDLSKYDMTANEKLYDIIFDDVAKFLSVDGIVTENDGDFEIALDAKKAAAMTANIKAVLPNDIDAIYDEIFKSYENMDMSEAYKTIIKSVGDEIITGLEKSAGENATDEEVQGLREQLAAMVDQIGGEMESAMGSVEEDKESAIAEIKKEIENLSVDETKDAEVKGTIKKIDGGYSISTEIDETEEDDEYGISSSVKGSISFEIKSFTGSISAPKGFVNLSDVVAYAFNVYNKYVQAAGPAEPGEDEVVDLTEVFDVEVGANQKLMSYDEETEGAVITAIEGYEFYGTGNNYITLMGTETEDYFTITDYGTLFSRDDMRADDKVDDDTYFASEAKSVSLYYFAENGSLFVISYSSYADDYDVEKINGEDACDYLVSFAKSFKYLSL